MAHHTKHQKSQSSWEIERLVPNSLPWYRRRLLVEHLQRYRFVKPYIRHKKVADIACGSGYGSYEMAKHAESVIAIDNNAKAIAYAKKYYSNPKISYILAEATKTLIPKESVDVVVSFETLEHLKNSNFFLREVNKILSPKGVLILSTPNKSYSVGTNHFHYYEYTAEELKELLLSEFRSVQLFGQREVHVGMFRFLKILTRIFPFLSFILPFRFWEHISIVPLSGKKTNFVYLLAVCKK